MSALDVIVPFAEPLLNEDSWLAKALLYWFPHFDGQWRDYGPNNFGVCDLVSGIPAIKASQFGTLSHDFENDTAAEFNITNGTTRLASVPAFSVSFWCFFSAYSNSPGTIAIYDDADPGDSDNSLFLIYPNDDVGGNGLRLFWNSGTVLDDNSNTVTVNGFHHFVVTSRSSTDHELYVDAVSKATSTSAEILASTTSRLSLGHWNGGQNAICSLFGVTVHTRGFTSAEVVRWYTQDRWDLYTSEKIPHYYQVGGAPPPDSNIPTTIIPRYYRQLMAQGGVAS